MKLGIFTIEQLSEGQFEIFKDGTINRKPVGDEGDKRLAKLAGGESSKIGINPVYISDGSHHILLDAGLGWGLDKGSSYHDVSNAVTNLDIFGIEPEDITHIILSHLHYDHMAGSSFTNTDSSTQPTFPNAEIIVQEHEWEYALSQVEQEKTVRGAGYQLDDFYRLVADGRVNFINDELEKLIPGIDIIHTGGHTPGHQIVRITYNNESAYYFGDLLPSEHHLNHYAMRQMDVNPLQSKKVKIQLLKTACKENAYLLFYHSLFSKVGRLDKDKHKKYVLKELT